VLTPEAIGDSFRGLLTGTDFELISVQLQPLPGRLKFVVALDHRKRGITIAEIEQWSRRFEEELDRSGEVPRQYALEVSSPGLTLPLTKTWQFAKNVGREFNVELQPDEGHPKGESFKAKLQAATDDTLTFEGGRIVQRTQLRLAKVALPW
jgi:ribosome maturation factor RimP